MANSLTVSAQLALPDWVRARGMALYEMALMGGTTIGAALWGRAAEFLEVMQETRRTRLQQGALDWQLVHDLCEPGRYVEQITDESWTEHLRRFDRLTAADVALRDRRLAFHIGQEPPQVSRFWIEPA